MTLGRCSHSQPWLSHPKIKERQSRMCVCSLLKIMLEKRLSLTYCLVRGGLWWFQEDLGLISMDELDDILENTYTICRWIEVQVFGATGFKFKMMDFRNCLESIRWNSITTEQESSPKEKSDKQMSGNCLVLQKRLGELWWAVNETPDSDITLLERSRCQPETHP